MKSAYDVIRETMTLKGVSIYRLRKATGDDQTFMGKVIRGVVPMPDRIRLAIAGILGLDAEDLRIRLVIEREGLDPSKIRAVLNEPPPVPPARERRTRKGSPEEAV